MQGKGGGVSVLSVAVHWVSTIAVWGFSAGAGQGQPPFVLPETTQHELQSNLQITATCTGLGGSQVKPNCDPKLAAANAKPGAA